jgi:hypothetical protein
MSITLFFGAFPDFFFFFCDFCGLLKKKFAASFVRPFLEELESPQYEVTAIKGANS